MPVVISADASKETKDVAAELAGYLRQMTGATFEVKSGDGKSGIVMGTLKQFPDPSLAKTLDIRNGFDGREAYAIRTEPKRVRLLGGAELGASHAAFRFLEKLGCRWFFPGKTWEVVPNVRKLTVDVNESSRPAVLSRRIWYGWGMWDDHTYFDYYAWGRHNRMAASLPASIGEAWQSIIAENAKTFEQHPEYLALVSGKRQGNQLCVSNPGLCALVTEWAMRQFERNSAVEMVSLAASDGGGQCECENCRKLGSTSNRVFGLANEVAQAVRKRFPGKWIGTTAYYDHCEPPSFNMEPNVLVMRARGFQVSKLTDDELARLWAMRSSHLGVYEYYSVYGWDVDMFPGGKAAYLPYLRESIPKFVRDGVIAIECESSNNWGIHGLGYYVANRLMWNPKTDVDALISDFHEKAFGPAANTMRRYYERTQRPYFVSGNLVAQLLDDLAQASEQAKSRPDVLARLDDLKIYLHYVRLTMDQGSGLLDEASSKATALERLTHVYRSRHSYMNHIRAMVYSDTAPYAERYKEPSWRYDAPNPPWMVNKPYTHDEIEQFFHDDQKRFGKPVELHEVKFSDDLVPGGFEGSTDNPSGLPYWYGIARYALYSRAGEPLEISIAAGTIPSYRNRPSGHCTILDPKGKRIGRRVLPLDGEMHALTFPVPRAGAYFAEIEDGGGGFSLTVPAGRLCALAPKRSDKYYYGAHMGVGYFYVPKGTKQVEYFLQGVVTHDVYDGVKTHKMLGDAQVNVIPVGPGRDGKVWYINNWKVGQLWFYNIPTLIAQSPAYLMVPGEIAQRDGLIKMTQ